MDKQTEKFIINNYIDIRKLLDNLGLSVRPNGSMYCPFHENTRTPSAHLYDDDVGGAAIFCYAEHRLFKVYDLYQTYLPNINLTELAQAIYDRLDQTQRDFITSNLNVEQELPELPYITSLRKFKKREIDYTSLIKDINMSIPLNETFILINKLYELPSITPPPIKNKYLYYISNYESQFKVISAAQALTLSRDMPDFIIEYLRHNGDCVLIPNKVGNVIYSLTLRNIQGKKQFLKIGDISHSLYNLGNLPKDFKYGTPLLLVEGNLDCESMKEVYPYTVASLTATLSTNQVQLISHLTDKVIIAYDNDDAGKEGYYIVRNKLEKLGMTVKKFNHALGLHDAGDLLDVKMKDPDEYDYLLRSYRNQINGML